MAAALGVDSQKKSWRYRERNSLEREHFAAVLATIPAHQQVYVDEAGIEDTLTYAYGWSRKGQRCWCERLGHRTARVSMAAACLNGRSLVSGRSVSALDLRRLLPCRTGGSVVQPATVPRAAASNCAPCCGQQLCPVLRPGQVVILDNAAFHRHETLRALVEAVGCTLLPLPSYSPDLNKIEPLWKTIKHRVALDTAPYPSFRLKVDAAFV